MSGRKVRGFLNDHKTKLTGLLLVVLGALQANSMAMQALLSEKQFAWLTVVIGVAVAALGFINTWSNNRRALEDSHDDGTAGESE